MNCVNSSFIDEFLKSLYHKTSSFITKIPQKQFHQRLLSSCYKLVDKNFEQEDFVYSYFVNSKSACIPLMYVTQFVFPMILLKIYLKSIIILNFNIKLYKNSHTRFSKQLIHRDYLNSSFYFKY